MALVYFNCEHCGCEARKEAGHINRSKRSKSPVYCTKKCAGLARRIDKTEAQKKEEKRLYDIEYKNKNHERDKPKRAAYYQRIKDPKKESMVRAKQKKERPWVEEKRREYMESKEYRERKKKYDRLYRAKKDYGIMWEAQVALLGLLDEVGLQITDYETRVQNGTLNKRLERKRDYERLNSEQLKRIPLGNLEQLKG